MYIKHFREVTYRVPDPMRPGHNAFDRRMDASGTYSLTHDGKTYNADSDGWIEVPDEVGRRMINFPGWCSPEMVDEEIVAGRIRRNDADALPNTRAEIGKPKPARTGSKKKATVSTKDVS